ncbi:hypothetical protein IFR05_010264 [Cadophora sp. M221]|nr:hypothetical protein IFR05_010264 [Cadophora sp. M221]
MTIVLRANIVDSSEQTPMEATERAGPAKAQWEIHRPQITHLYRDKNMKLKEVMTVMEDVKFNASERMYKDRLKSAIDFWKRGLLNEFRRLLSKACELVPDILRSAYPRTLDRILGVFILFIRQGLPEIAHCLRTYIAKMAAVVIGSQLPWNRLCRLLGMLEAESLDQAIITSWKCTNDALRSGLGRFSESSIKADLCFLEYVHGSQNQVEEERLLRTLLSEFEKTLGTSNPLVMKVIIRLAQNQLHQRNNQEAEDLANDILSAALDRNSQVTVVMQMKVLSVLAASQYRRKAFHSAEKSIRRAIKITRDEWGVGNPWIIRYMTVLEEWLREWGRIEEVDELRMEIDSVVGLDDTDTGELKF